MPTGLAVGSLSDALIDTELVLGVHARGRMSWLGEQLIGHEKEQFMYRCSTGSCVCVCV